MTTYTSDLDALTLSWSAAIEQLTAHAERMARLADVHPDDVLALGIDRLVRAAAAADASPWGDECPAVLVASAKACQRFGARRLSADARASRGADWLDTLWTDVDRAEAAACMAELLGGLRADHSATLLRLMQGETPSGGTAWRQLAEAREALAVACLRHGFESVARSYLRTLDPVLAELVRLRAQLGTRD